MQNETIVDRVVARLKAQPLGDLITEEDLHDIVKQAIPKTFFERRVKYDGYNRREQSLDPLIVEVMGDLLKASATVAMQTWLADNAGLIVEQWKKALDAGLMTYVKKLQDEAVTNQVRTMFRPLVEQLNNERQKVGLPGIFI